MGRLSAVLAWCLVAGVCPDVARTGAAPADTLQWRFEAGARSDWTTEQFYEDLFSDTTFLERRLVDTPESRNAGVFSAVLTGTRNGRRQSFHAGTDVSLGDRLSRGAVHGNYRHESDRMRWTTTPRAEYERDRTFGRDLERLRLAADTRFRFGLGDGENRLEGGAGGEWMRARGGGSQYLLDRAAVRTSLGFEHLPVLGTEWRAAWILTARAFPDSSVRDHVEHGWEAHVRRDLAGGHSWMVETRGARRIARRPGPDSRDRYVDAGLMAEGNLRFAPSWVAGLSAGLEALRYDEADSAVFFDYGVARARIMPRFERGTWTLAIGPRIEALETTLGSLEEYREVSAVLEFEGLLPSVWWSFAPEFGWREYREPVSSAKGGPADFGAHSSYRFIELNLYADHSLPGGVRVRLLGSGRHEAHTQAADDARSFYISADVRKIF